MTAAAQRTRAALGPAHLLPGPLAELPDGGVDGGQWLLGGEVQEVEGVVEVGEGLGAEAVVRCACPHWALEPMPGGAGSEEPWTYQVESTPAPTRGPRVPWSPAAQSPSGAQGVSALGLRKGPGGTG